MLSLTRVLGLLVFFAGISVGSHAMAQYAHVPDRCPEPCEIGGTHVSPDYQRLTVPFRIRSGDSDLYLRVSGRSVSVAPLVNDDDSFLWVFMRGPTPKAILDDTRQIVRGNGFEAGPLYKIINLQNSLALTRSVGSGRATLKAVGATRNSFSTVTAAATYDGNYEYFLFSKLPGKDSFLLYNPDTISASAKINPSSSAANAATAAFLRSLSLPLSDWLPEDIDSRRSVTIDAAGATFATMPALMVPAGETSVIAQLGADSGGAGFRWHLEEAPEPRDLARLTIRRVQVFKPSEGHDSGTDVAIFGGELVAGIAGGWAAGKVTTLIEKSVLKELAEKGVRGAAEQLAERAAKEAAEKAAKGSLTESVEAWAKREMRDQISPKMMQGSLYKNLVGGLIYVAAVPFRAGWWVAKESGEYVGRKVIKVAQDKARPILKAAREILADRRNIKKILHENDKAIAKFLAKKTYSFVIKPYMEEMLGDDGLAIVTVQSDAPARVFAARAGSLGGEIGDLKNELARLETEWSNDLVGLQPALANLKGKWLGSVGPTSASQKIYLSSPIAEMIYLEKRSGYLRNFYADMAKSIAEELRVIDPNLAVMSYGLGSKTYVAMDYVPEQEIHEVPFSYEAQTEFYSNYLKNLDADRERVASAQDARPGELIARQKSLGLSDAQAASELRDVRRRLVDAENKEFALASLKNQLSEIISFQSKVSGSANPSLILADPRVVTYNAPPDIISDDTYRKCMDTKVFSLPVTNAPYGRLGSAQAAHEMAEMTKSLSGIVDGSVTGMDAAFVSAMAAVDIATGGIGFLADEFKKLSEMSDDQLKIYVDGKQVWPEGGSGYSNIGKNSQRQRVDVEHIFRRGDTVTIRLIEGDVGGAFGSADDDLGSVRISSNHLFDRETYEGVYIESTSEGSLYAVDLILEPFYAPTPAELERQRADQEDCPPVVKQAEAQEFAFAVEKTRIDGRLALMADMGEDAVKTFDANALWAEDICPFGTYGSVPYGEWRVGTYDKFGRADHSVTWTNTFARIDNWGKDSDFRDGKGLMVTPSETGVWNTRNWSSLYFVQNRKEGRDNAAAGDLGARPGWTAPVLDFDTGASRSPLIAPTRYSDDSCEIYALMYGKDGMLGRLGPEFEHPNVLRYMQELIDKQVKEDPEVIQKEAELQSYIDQQAELIKAVAGQSNSPFERRKSMKPSTLSERRDEVRNLRAIKRSELEHIQERYTTKSREFYSVENEQVFALRGGQSHDGFDGVMYGIADKSTPEYQAVEFLNTFYTALPESRSGVDANLLLKASGPANLWMEKISEDPGGKAKQANSLESPDTIKQVRQAISGSWAVAPFIERATYRTDQQRANTKDRDTWVFIENGSFIAKPESDFWFTPPVQGTWEYIGDQRIEVTTKASVQIAVATENARDNATGFDDLGTSFIVKMQQEPGSRTKFSGFFVQGSNGQKVVWSERLHPGKSPFEVPELYSDAFFDLLVKVSEVDGSTLPVAYQKKAEANKTAMAAKLADLTKLKSDSPCNVGKPDELFPGNTALQGKWRVGQYDASGQKQYLWNYTKTRAPSWLHTREEWRDLGVNYVSDLPENTLQGWRPDDFRLADQPSTVFERSADVGQGGYQQEWQFGEDQSGKLTISTRVDGGKFRYKNGDIAPVSARRQGLVRDAGTGNFLIKFQDAYSDDTKLEGLDMQKINSPAINAGADDLSCLSGQVTMPNLADGEIKTDHTLSVVYHENGDKEFYVTKADGTLWLWGLQEPDRTKYTYKYDNKLLTPLQAANLCETEMNSLIADTSYPFSFADETMHKRNGIFILRNGGLKPLGVFRNSQNEVDIYQSHTLEPGGYAEFDAKDGEKVAVLDDRKNIRYIDRFDVCVAAKTVDMTHQVISTFKFGQGFVPTQKQTDAIEAKEACSSFVSPDSFRGRLSEIEFMNNGSTPLVIYRLGGGGKKINPNGDERTNPANFDPAAAFDYGVYYQGLEPIVTLPPWSSQTLRTRVGYAFEAIKRGDQWTEQEWREDQGKVVDVLKGNREICFARIKASGPSELITFGDGLSPDEARDRDRDRKEQEQKELIANGCIDFGKARSSIKDRFTLGGAAHVVNSGGSDLTVHWINYAGNYDAANPVLTVKPGQTGKVVDFLGAKYQILNTAQKCAGIISPVNTGSDGEVRKTFTYGNQSVPVTGEVIDPHLVAGLKPPLQPTRHQLANGCSLYGNIASKPHSTFQSAGKRVVNAGSTPLTVQWLSYYGQLQDREEEREPRPTWTIEPGKGVTFDKDTVGVDDIFAVIEGDGECVAVIQARDPFVEETEVQSRVPQTLGQAYKNYYVLRDRKSAAEFDIRVAQWNLDKKTHKEKLAELEALWARSDCGDGGSSYNASAAVTTELNDFSELVGRWDVGTYDRGARTQQFVGSPGLWTFSPLLAISGKGPSGEAVSATGLPSDCTIEKRFPGGDKLKLIFKPDGEKEFFVLGDSLPEVLYSDGTTGRPSMALQIDASSATNVQIKDEPHLKLWGRKLPSIGILADTDVAADEVAEDASIGDRVGITANAIDPDDTVSYSVSGDLFAVDSETGVVTVAAALDYNTAQSQRLTITATSPDTSAVSKEFKISLRPVNQSSIGKIVDADPAGYAAYSRGWKVVGDHVNENADIGARIGITAQAIDADSNDTVAYNLTDDASSLFAIDPQSGVITVAGKLDWETAESHSIEVTATSSDGSSSRKQFEIILEDINEFAVGDVADSDSRPDAVDETAPIDTEVGVTAFAMDEDGSATVTYSIDDNRNGTAFKIAPDTGILTLQMELNREDFSDIDINVKATSSDGSTSKKVFRIAVNDVNEFDVSDIVNTLSSDGIGVREDAAVGIAINLRADARDRDATDDVTFSLANAEDVPFIIDPKTGEVTVARSMDMDEIAGYTLEIVADSTDGSQSRMSFLVPVKDINEYGVSALIDADDTSDAVYENAASGTPVGITAFADDLDATDEITYSISDDFSPFVINPATGVITVSNYAKLNAQTRAQEPIWVVASSSSGETTSFEFKVDVINVNAFEVGHVSNVDGNGGWLDENTPIGALAGVTAFADDLDTTDTVTYQLADDAGGLFAIDPVSGVVSVAGPLDFEAAPSGYTITVTARSSDGSVTQYPLRQDIRLRDVNEFGVTEPVDMDPAINEVFENTPRGTRVGIIANATDADATKNRISYVVVDHRGNDLGMAGGPFSIDLEGVVTTTDLFMLDVDGKITVTSIWVIAYSEDGSESETRFDIGVVYAPKWWENPTGPRIEADFPTVSESDWQACRMADENWKNQTTFNTENAYFDCLQAAIPAIVFWRDDPMDPRGDDLAVYDGIPHDDYGVCRTANDDEASQTFNNETAYYDCLNSVLERVRPVSGAGGGQAANVNACAAGHQVYYEVPVDADAKMTVTNTGAADLSVYAVTAPGTADFAASQVAVVMPGQSLEFIAKRQEGFAVMGQGDVCVGAIKAWESRNSASFAHSADALTGTGENSGQDLGSAAADVRAGKDYSSVPADANEACGVAWPNSPQDDKGYYDCMDAAISQASRADAQGIDYRISNEYPDLTQDEIRGCDYTEYGSDDFFACLGHAQTTKLSAADEQTPENGNKSSSDGQEPGWDRATVFYQPAYDYCLGERRLEFDSAAFDECYYAYPNY